MHQRARRLLESGPDDLKRAMGLLGPQPGEQRRQGSILCPGEPSEQLIGQAVPIGGQSGGGTAEGVTHYPQTIHGGRARPIVIQS
jgi:hypothetical protein